MRYLTITLFVISAFTVTTQAQRIGGRANKPNPEAARNVEGSKPSGTHLSETQKQNLQKLQADLQAIQQGSQVTTEQKQALKNDLMAMAEGATKPDPALVQQLANDLSEAIADGSIDNKEKAQLANDLQKVMTSANIPPEEVNQAIADAQAILTASGVDKSEVQTIVSDLKAIATEAKNNAPNGGAKAPGVKGKFKRSN